MSIRPVDMQVMLPKLDQNFYAKQNVVNRNLNEHANAVEINHAQIERKFSSVQGSEGAAKSDYLRREQGKRGEDCSKDADSSDESGHEQVVEKEFVQHEIRNYNSFGEIKKIGGKFVDLKI